MRIYCVRGFLVKNLMCIHGETTCSLGYSVFDWDCKFGLRYIWCALVRWVMLSCQLDGWKRCRSVMLVTPFDCHITVKLSYSRLYSQVNLFILESWLCWTIICSWTRYLSSVVVQYLFIWYLFKRINIDTKDTKIYMRDNKSEIVKRHRKGKYNNSNKKDEWINL